MSLKSKALTISLTTAILIVMNQGAYASSYEDHAWGSSASGSNVSVDGTRVTAQEELGSVDSSPVEPGGVRAHVGASVQRRMSCWELRDAGYLDLDDPKCKNVTWNAGVDGIPDENHMLRPRPTPPDADEAPAESVPAEVLLEYAVAQVQASGAGVVKQPMWDTLMGVPTLVYVTSPTQTLTTTLFGEQVAVMLEATRFSYDFGDGTPALVTTDPGAPYPARRVYHVYERRQSDVVITLTTTWRGSVTSPFDGSTASLNGVVTTVESTDPFRVCKAHIYTVPLPEERTREEQARLDEFERRSKEECNVWNTTNTH